MPNRYNNYSDEPKGYPKHIKNTDNESTQYISPNSDSMNTAELPPIHRQNSPNRQHYYNPNQQNQQNYQPNPNRQQYYNPNQQNQQNYQSNPNRQQYYNPNQQNYQPNPNRQHSSGYYNTNNSGARQQSYNTHQNGQRPASPPPYDRNNGNRHQSSAPPPRNPQQRPQQQRQREVPPKPKKRKRHPIRKIIIRIICVILILLLILFGIYSCTALSLIKKMNYTESGNRNHVAGALDASYVTSILLIGTDGRTLDDRGRSDTMILLSLNKSTHKITLTSFLRDSYVDIPGYGQNKLNHSYSYGGPDLLMDTIELNFNVCIDDYILVNFNSFASIIDSVNGIEMDISDEEAQEINTILMAELNELMGDNVDDDLLSNGGKVQLNGKQALAYARIRHVGNADFERTERQREVITKAVGKLKSFRPSIISSIAKNAIPQVTTNMDTMQLYSLSLRLPLCLGYEIEQVRIPADNTYWSTTTSDGGDALAFDFDANYAILRDQVYGK